MEKPIPIAEAIDSVVTRLGATAEQAWAGIKLKVFYGRLSLEGIDDEGRPSAVERHWIRYIEAWGTDNPPPAPVSGKPPIPSDMPRKGSGSVIAFDRERACRDRRVDERDGREPRAVPPMRLRDLMADGAQLDELWARAEYEFKSLDWSLGNILSWIAFKDPVLICKFDSRRDLVALRFYDHPRSNLPPREQMLVPNADHALLDALKGGRLSAIRNGAEIPSTYWFGKYTRDLTQDLRFRRSEVMAICWQAERGETAVEPPASPRAPTGAFIPLEAAVEPDSRLREIIETAWQGGEITLWGRRPDHSVWEPIERYHGLEIIWHASAPRGDYYAEARAQPKRIPGADFRKHQWADLTIPATDLTRLRDSRADIAAAIDAVEECGQSSSSASEGAGPRVNAPQRRGRKPIRRENVVARMLADIQSGAITLSQLSDMLEKQLASKYEVSRDTARKARADVLDQK